jgi:hypothetical protein
VLEKVITGTLSSQILVKGKSIKDSGKLINIKLHGRGWVLFSLLMDLSIREWHWKDFSMVKVEFSMPMETYITENGKKERRMEKVSWLIRMAQCMKESGWMINITERESNNGITTKLNILEIS